MINRTTRAMLRPVPVLHRILFTLNCTVEEVLCDSTRTICDDRHTPCLASENIQFHV